MHKDTAQATQSNLSLCQKDTVKAKNIFYNIFFLCLPSYHSVFLWIWDLEWTTLTIRIMETEAVMKRVTPRQKIGIIGD